MKFKQNAIILIVIVMLTLTGCHLPGAGQTGDSEALDTIEEFTPDQQGTMISSIDSQVSSGDGTTPQGALDPNDLIYLGAFRLPDDSGGMGWAYSGHGMTYYPDGDPGGDGDGFGGSLYIVGHDQQLYVAEVSIPEPIVSDNLDDLETAVTLQPFADITGGHITEDLALPRMGIEYLPAVGEMTEAKLHFTLGQHIQDFEPSHGWASLDLSDPDSAGLWMFDGFTNYVTNDYLFEIPEDWADTYVQGYRLATGRFREGVWSGFGPSIFACAPWLDGNPPPAGATLTEVQPLLLYGIQPEGLPEIQADESTMMNGYAESDHWWGGAWLTSEAGDAVVFTGTKALGKNWYGFANGVVWDYACADDPALTCPEVPDFPYDNRGFWAEDFMPAILFFDPTDLAKVATGEWETYQPQPYAMLDLTDTWFDPVTRVEIYKRDLVGAAAFDRLDGLLFVVERLGDEAKSVIHVFSVGS
jgi:hypothetical protein